MKLSASMKTLSKLHCMKLPRTYARSRPIIDVHSIQIFLVAGCAGVRKDLHRADGTAHDQPANSSTASNCASAGKREIRLDPGGIVYGPIVRDMEAQCRYASKRKVPP